MTQDPRAVRRRDEPFTKRLGTRIWQEEASADNPYVAAVSRCHGYDLMELVARCSFAEVLYLLFRGELPSAPEAELLQALMIGLVNPGPRHPATRAAICAGGGKTLPSHILPIALSVLGGEHLGAAEVERAMRFLEASRERAPAAIAAELLARPRPGEGDVHVAPGFGSRFGSIDEVPQKLAAHLAALPGAGKTLGWGRELVEALRPGGFGWLSPGIAAAVFADLGFHPRAGVGLFQILSAPGLFAHGVEFAGKPLTAMPFLEDEHYHIESD
jgi:citrate synthase